MGVARRARRPLVASYLPVARRKHTGQGAVVIPLGFCVDDGQVTLLEKDRQKGSRLSSYLSEEKVLLGDYGPGDDGEAEQ